MFRYGVKLWSTNRQDIFKQALELYAKRRIDFIELYVHPKAADPEKFKLLKKAAVTIHATKYEDDFDISELTRANAALFKKQVIGAADFLKADLIVLHAGRDVRPEVFKKNLKKIFDPRIVIENMPKIFLDDNISFGNSLSQLRWIKKNCQTDFCLDIGHAVKAAACLRLNYKVFLKDLMNLLEPKYFHLSGGFRERVMDEHLNIFDGNIDYRWVKTELEKLNKVNDIRLVFETPKIGDNLDNDLKNIKYFKSL